MGEATLRGLEAENEVTMSVMLLFIDRSKCGFQTVQTQLRILSDLLHIWSAILTVK